MNVRINRNILECKVKKGGLQAEWLVRINRNILECKVGSHCQSYKGILVLIETYWNVK